MAIVLSQTLFSQFQPLSAIATTPQAAQTLQPLCQATGATLWLPQSLGKQAGSQNYTNSLANHTAFLWQKNNALIFCLATGAVVRLIAPLLEDKATDPAVVVVDQQGKFVISLCSAHQGGADQLAELIAQQLGATAILTGASSSLNLPAIDTLGMPFGWRKGEGDWLGVSAAIARGEVVDVVQEAGSTLWQQHLPPQHPFNFVSERNNSSQQSDDMVKADTESGDAVTRRIFCHTSVKSCQNSAKLPKKPGSFAKVFISHRHRSMPVGTPRSLCRGQWHPRVLWVGIGCERGTSHKVIATAIEEVFQNHHLAPDAIAGIATIDIKVDEIGIQQLCQHRNFPLKTFPAQALQDINVPNPSQVVRQEVGTPSVAEAAAILAANSPSQSLLVPKQIFRLPGEPGAVTVAVAQAAVEYTGRFGKLYLVGTGPGNLEQITPAAQNAITQADAVIGYTLYLELIQSLHRPGQIIEASPITQERQRAQRAIELAQWGLTVAVVSSGDCGIYGMAGLVLELLQNQAWDGKNPQIQVFPGITALQSAAAKVGAPLMHDFCAISLSDLLTPWEVIQKRLEAAAQADFVTAIYNPRSRTRTEQIVTAQEIFLCHRDPNTPVAIVRSAYRFDEQVTITTLEQMLQLPIDMLTTVIIGNSSSTQHGDWIITPRGYHSSVKEKGKG